MNVAAQELEATRDAVFLEAYERMRGSSLETIMAGMPELSGDPANAAGFYDLRPEGDFDEKKALAVISPHATGGTPFMYMRYKLLQNSLREPTRILWFPQNTREQLAYCLSSEDILRVQDGDFDPITRRMVLSALHEGVEDLGVDGFSAGADMGATLVAEGKEFLNISGAVLVEPVGTHKREGPFDGELQLGRDFLGTSGSDLEEAVKSTDIPAFVEAQNMQSRWAKRKMLSGFARFALNVFMDENRAISKGLAQGKFSEDIHLTDGQNGLIARADKSTVCLEKEFNAQKDTWEKLGWCVMTYSGTHASGDDIVTQTLLSKYGHEHLSDQKITI